MIDRSTNIFSALRSRQRGFLLNPFRFGGTPPGDTDPYFSNVSLLLHMDGANGSTTFTDSSGTPKTVTAYGNAQISTDQSKYGGASGLFDGAGDYLTIPQNSAFDLGIGDFTIDLWFRPTAVNVYHALLYTGAYETGQFSLRVTDTGRLQTFINNGTNGYGLVTGSTQLTAGSWSFISVSCNAGVIRVFLNGNLETSKENTSYIYNSSLLYIGAQVASGTPALSPSGHIEEFRITKGVARYTANFTPPTAPFPNS